MISNQPSFRKRVLAIRTPLRPSEPIYVQIDDDSQTIEEILLKTISLLEEAGRNHEALSLEKLLLDHKIIVSSKV